MPPKDALADIETVVLHKFEEERFLEKMADLQNRLLFAYRKQIEVLSHQIHVKRIHR